MENANKPQTERKKPALLFARAFVILLYLKYLLLWAWEELNFRPHAYQASRAKGNLHGFRTLIGVRSGRLLLYRKEPPADRSQFRKQTANTKAVFPLPRGSFRTFAAWLNSERYRRAEAWRARRIKTRQLAPHELAEIRRFMRPRGAA